MAPAWSYLFFFIWHYLPIWETKIAFEQYRIIPPNIWVGMQYFATLMSSPVFWQVIQNTVIIGAMKLIFYFSGSHYRGALAQ